MKTAIGLLGGITLGLLLNAACSPHKAAEAAKPAEYEEIGNGIKRTDDRERGVSCYYKIGQSGRPSLSCVLTGVGQEQGIPR